MTPSQFTICFDAHRHDGKVWAVRQRRRWRLARAIEIHAPVWTVYLGKDARQPKAYLQGYGVVRGTANQLTIQAA